ACTGIYNFCLYRAFQVLSSRRPGESRDPPPTSRVPTGGSRLSPGLRFFVTVPAFAGIRDFLFLRGAGDYGDHRIADVFDVFGQHAGFDRREAGVLEVALDEKGVALIVEGAPDRHRLGRETAVRE